MVVKFLIHSKGCKDIDLLVLLRITHLKKPVNFSHDMIANNWHIPKDISTQHIWTENAMLPPFWPRVYFEEVWTIWRVDLGAVARCMTLWTFPTEINTIWAHIPIHNCVLAANIKANSLNVTSDRVIDVLCITLPYFAVVWYLKSIYFFDCKWFKGKVFALTMVAEDKSIIGDL